MSNTAGGTPQSEMEAFDFDIALSFAGEDREKAEALAEGLASKGIRVFYDLYEQAVLWGKDLYQHLQTIYRDKARYCIIFVSEAYAKKLWTRHELQQAQARAFRENQEYILPLRLDDTEIPGLNPTIGYLDLRRISLLDVREIVLEKLGFGTFYHDPRRLSWNGELIEFRGHKVTPFWPEKLKEAQSQTTYVVTRAFERVRYGEETHPWNYDVPCHDCYALPGEYHVPGCDVEECPCCGEQALACGCDFLWSSRPEDGEPEEPATATGDSEIDA